MINNFSIEIPTIPILGCSEILDDILPENNAIYTIKFLISSVAKKTFLNYEIKNPE